MPGLYRRGGNSLLRLLSASSFSSRQVRVHRGDSRVFLSRIATEGTAGTRPMFYLDAHCHLSGSIALVDELAIIEESCADASRRYRRRPVADDPGYGYDTYDGQPINFESLGLPEGRFQAYWPALASSDETGWRRGTVVLATSGNVAVSLRNARTLRTAVAEGPP